MEYLKIISITALTLVPEKLFAATEGGGLPQMDISSYPSQIFWLIITFGVLYIFMWKIAIPRLRTTVEERKDKISTDLSDAEQLKIEAQSIIEEYEVEISNSNNEASLIFNNAKSEIDKKIDVSKKETEEKIKKSIEEAQNLIEKKEKEAVDDIKAKTIETTQSIIQKFIDKKINEEEIRKHLN